LSVAQRAYWSFSLSLAAQRRKFAIEASKEERRLLIKGHDEPPAWKQTFEYGDAGEVFADA
jgi:hypothetical protein